jgi:hypothetical protein
MGLDFSLLRPRYVIRAEQAFQRNRKLHAGARICWKKFLFNRDVQNPPQHSQLLMHGCRLQLSVLDKPRDRFRPYAVAQPVGQQEVTLKCILDGNGLGGPV